MRNRFKGLIDRVTDLIDRSDSLKNYGQRFVTLYRRQGSRSSPRKRNAKRQNGCLRRLYICLWNSGRYIQTSLIPQRPEGPLCSIGWSFWNIEKYFLFLLDAETAVDSGIPLSFICMIHIFSITFLSLGNQQQPKNNQVLICSPRWFLCDITESRIRKIDLIATII